MISSLIKILLSKFWNYMGQEEKFVGIYVSENLEL